MLIFHWIVVGLWVGCVVIETIAELYSRRYSQPENPIAAWHWRVDQYVEIPTLILVTVSGILLLDSAIWTSLLTLKVLFGAAAVVLNGFCVLLVYRRYQSQLAGDTPGYHSADTNHNRVGTLVILCLILALITGLANHWVI